MKKSVILWQPFPQGINFKKGRENGMFYIVFYIAKFCIRICFLPIWHILTGKIERFIDHLGYFSAVLVNFIFCSWWQSKHFIIILFKQMSVYIIFHFRNAWFYILIDYSILFKWKKSNEWEFQRKLRPLALNVNDSNNLLVLEK